jgi:hypothetical protein
MAEKDRNLGSTDPAPPSPLYLALDEAMRIEAVKDPSTQRATLELIRARFKEQSRKERSRLESVYRVSIVTAVAMILMAIGLSLVGVAVHVSLSKGIIESPLLEASIPLILLSGILGVIAEKAATKRRKVKFEWEVLGRYLDTRAELLSKNSSQR